jgi:DNA-binding NarL/FixJ family response regulator
VLQNNSAKRGCVMTLVEPSATATPEGETARTCTIVLVDGQRLFRQALRMLLSEAEFTVVGEAGQAAEALELIASVEPDVVVSDLELPDGSAVPLIGQIHARFPKVAILVLTALRARDAAATSRRAGALGYVLKDCGRSELLTALREVAAGRRYRSFAPAAPVVWRRVAEASAGARAAYLTERQRQVLRSVARGYRTREIAQMLGVSVRAVHKQRERLRITLQLDSTAALTRFAVREGLAEETPAP